MRLIDADALKDYIDEQDIRPFIALTVGEALKIMTDEQPTITPELHWIPCEERLPEVKQKVLVQYADGSMATKRCNDAGHLAWFYSNAVAWMPAPEPYKGVTAWVK